MSCAGRTIGILPALGSGLTDLSRSGQHQRLLEYDLRHYADAYECVLYFSYFDEALADFTRDPRLLERIRVLPRRGPWSPWLYALLMPWLYRREFRRCEVLRVMQFPGVVPALLARLLYRVPYVVTYGYHYAELARLAGSRVKPWLYRLLERLALPCAAGVIVTSPEMDAAVRPRATGIGYFPNGVDLEAFSPVPTSPPVQPAVLYVGRLEREKNVARLIDAVAALAPRKVRLVLVGNGSLRPALERRAREAGVTAEFVGTIPHGMLPGYFRAATVFVLPSLSEGHPKALVEAMACALPCAAAARGGILSLIDDGTTGVLFDPEDVGAIAAALARVLDDASGARRLGAAARAAAARYDVRRLMDQEVAFVRAVVRPPTPRGIFEAYAEAFPIDEVLPEFVERRLVQLARERPERVLDLGAGDGRYIDLFTRILAPGALVVGVEISLLRAGRMRERGFRVVVAQSEALPFRAGTFDLVTLIEVIEHTASPEASLDEVRRVLRPGGRLALTTPNYPIKRLYDLRAAVRTRSLARLRDDPTHFSPLSAPLLSALLRERFDRVRLEATAILGESRFAFVRRLKDRPLGLRLANKLFALCSKTG